MSNGWKIALSFVIKSNAEIKLKNISEQCMPFHLEHCILKSGLESLYIVNNWGEVKYIQQQMGKEID